MKTRILSFTVAVSVFFIPEPSWSSELITRPNSPSATAADHSSNPQFSGDGGVLLFSSVANNLVTNDNLDIFVDLFAYRLSDSRISLVTGALDGTGGGNGDTYESSVSFDGQLVAFASAANNLVGADINQAVDIFVRDLPARLTRLISKGPDGQAATASLQGNLRLCRSPQLSSNGNKLVFESYATNLTNLPDENQSSDIYFYDFASDQLSLVSANAQSSAAAQGSSSQPSLSSDGHRVAFVSTATDLTDQNTGTNRQVYLRDLITGAIQLASGDVSAWVPEDHQSTIPSLSADGSVLVFRVTSAIRDVSLLVLYDVQSQQSTLVTSNAHLSAQPIISASGRWVVYYDAHDVYRWDRLTATSDLVSVRSDGNGPGDRPAVCPAMTLDGRYISFVSSASDLTNPPGNGQAQVYWRDMETGTTLMVSRTALNEPSVDSTDPVPATLAPTGSPVAYQSAARDLVENDFNAATDVFLRALPSGMTRVISRPDSALPADSGSGFPSLGWQPIDADNTRIVFAAFDQTPSDRNGWPDIFLRLRALTVPLSVDSIDLNATTEPHFQTNGPAYHAGISADAGSVVYIQSSQASTPYFRAGNVVWIDLQTGARRILDDDVNQPPEVVSGGSHDANISSNGRSIAFYNDGRGSPHVVVRNLDDPAQDWKSQPASASGPGYFLRFTPDNFWLIFVSEPRYGKLAAWNLLTDQVRVLETNAWYSDNVRPNVTISANSRYVFVTRSDATILRHDLLAPSGSPGEIICTQCRMPSASGDGQIVAYQGGQQELLVKNLTTGETINLSSNQAPFSTGEGPSSPIVTHDGRFVCYVSPLNHELPEETHSTPDVFVRDLLTGLTCRISPVLKSTGAALQTSGSPVLGPDGRTVLFISLNPGLVEHDYNNGADIFKVQLGLGDSDNDGMDDQWEITHFGNLERDGSSDFDHDGSTDLAEYVSGTSPTDDKSVLEVLIMTEASNGSKTLFWPAIPGKVYQVESKTTLTGSAWTALSPPLAAGHATESYTDAGGAAEIYYRVRVLR